MTKEIYDYEYTDTYSGQANYCWVRRGTVQACSMRGAMIMAKKTLGLNGVRGRSSSYGGSERSTIHV